jgi:hypothetical protein
LPIEERATTEEAYHSRRSSNLGPRGTSFRYLWNMTARKVPKVIVALNLPKRVPDMIAHGKTIVSMMTCNAYFPKPVPSLATVSKRISALEAAHTVALTRVVGAAGAKEARRVDLVQSLEELAAYVQQIANADPANAKTIVTSAGMFVKGVGSRAMLAFWVRMGRVSGMVLLFAKAAAKRASYEWQWSLDQKTWTDLEPTLQANTAVYDLTPGLTYYFRHRARTKSGAGDWSQIVSLIVE